MTDTPTPDARAAIAAELLDLIADKGLDNRDAAGLLISVGISTLTAVGDAEGIDDALERLGSALIVAGKVLGLPATHLPVSLLDTGLKMFMAALGPAPGLIAADKALRAMFSEHKDHAQAVTALRDSPMQ